MHGVARWRAHPGAAVLLLTGVALLLFAGWGWWSSRRGAIDRGGYAARNWSESRRRSLHISGYAFRDRNRSGRLDLGDQGMAWVAFELETPRDARGMARTNIAG